MKENRDYEIGLRIKFIQYKLGYDNSQMASIFDVTVDHYRKMVRGAASFTKSQLVLLATKLNVSMDYLFYGESVHEMFLTEEEITAKNSKITKAYLEKVMSNILGMPFEEKIDNIAMIAEYELALLASIKEEIPNK